MNNGILISAGMFAAIAYMASPASAGDASSAVANMAKKDAARVEAASNVTSSQAHSANTNGLQGQLEARGVVMPNAEVTLGAGLALKIDEMPFKAGQAFKTGDTLIKFNCGRQQADLRGAKANLNKAATLHRGKRRLKSRGAAGNQEVREAAADMAIASATVDGLRAVISLCTITAPFDGHVVERHAESHEIPAANAPLLTVVDDSSLELDLIVPSTWLRWVKKGSTFEFTADELGETYQASVDRMGAKIDAVSQTIKITGKFIKRPPNILAGMSGTAKFSPPTN